MVFTSVRMVFTSVRIQLNWRTVSLRKSSMSERSTFIPDSNWWNASFMSFWSILFELMKVSLCAASAIGFSVPALDAAVVERGLRWQDRAKYIRMLGNAGRRVMSRNMVDNGWMQNNLIIWILEFYTPSAMWVIRESGYGTLSGNYILW